MFKAYARTQEDLQCMSGSPVLSDQLAKKLSDKAILAIDNRDRDTNVEGKVYRRVEVKPGIKMVLLVIPSRRYVPALVKTS